MNTNQFRRDAGNILVMSVTFVGVLLVTGLAYMKWAVDEGWDSAYEQATVQAYFCAQVGVIKEGLEFLKTRQPTELPQGEVFLKPGDVPGAGEYLKTVVRRVAGGGGNIFQRSDTYDVFSTGRVKLPRMDYTTRSKKVYNVERVATMRARLRSFANYMYLTNYEVTEYGEIIWFWHMDTLWGRVHSNDYIGIKFRPVFYGPVSTSKGEFKKWQDNAYFQYPPIFDAPEVFFPKTAQSIRNNAVTVTSNDGKDMVRLVLQGGQGIEVWRYPKGSDPEIPGVMKQDNSIGGLAWTAIFVDGECEIMGTLVGCVTIGSAGDMWLIDNVAYAGSNQLNGHFGVTPAEQKVMKNMLGLVSEKNIIIKNNVVNGRLNGAQYGSQNIAKNSININAGMIALGETFTFQDQNDEWNLYQGPTPDERGVIHLTGAVTQWRRGYVHRSNHGVGSGTGTGYGKDYIYDFRFDERPPPYYLEAVDENGNGLFDIISWGEVQAGKD